MAVAAYTAVVSLMHVLDQIPKMHMLHLDRNQIRILHENVSVLQDFLEIHSQRFHEGLEYLARQIAAVADEAEGIIDAHVLDQLMSQRSADEIYVDVSSFCRDIDRVTGKMDSIKKELMTVTKGMTAQEQRPRIGRPADVSAPPSRKNTPVGFEEQLVRIMDELTGYTFNPQILAIVGMGGIGKTTLARNVFDHAVIAYHFHVRLWVTISQEYRADGILVGLLQDMGVVSKDKKSGDDLAELREKLYKNLLGRKYLIVMDDVWSIEVWNEIKLFFPDKEKGSRIMVTTRLSNVAVSLGCHNPYLMDFLDEDQSWNLFCEKAFTEGCPPELEKIGKKIARSCRGLPLAIVVIGGLLSNSSMTRQYWELIAENVNSFANSANDEYCLRILSLSYNHLPLHLKPCFLYMRVFPEDHEIRVSRLIKLWVAEGFLKPIREKTLEEVAEGYLKDLIDRNLILIRRRKLSGKIRTCGIHDLLRDLCLRESQKEHFHYVSKLRSMDMVFRRKNMLRIPEFCYLCLDPNPSTEIYLPEIRGISRPTSLVSCFVCDACRVMHPQLDTARLVRATEPSRQYGLSTKLRYLDTWEPSHFVFVPTLLPVLWNLQTLIITGPFHGIRILLPSGIWDMRQLRHLIIDEVVLPDRPERKDSTTVLEDLQTLSFIRNFRCSVEIIERIPNLKKLRIIYHNADIRGMEWSYYSLHNLVRLRRPESLLLDCYRITLKEMSFPHSLRKLKLCGCIITSEEMTITGSLPNLEVLDLDSVDFEESEWNPVEGEFVRLKLLFIWGSNLKYWRAERIHFPILESLVLNYTHDLVNIPSEIGDIETLRLIRLVGCNESVVNSAREILEEQQSLGNEILQLDVLDRMWKN